MHVLQPGLILYKTYLSHERQEKLVQAIHRILQSAPFFKAISPRKKPLGSLMTNMGELGWYSDITNGYRYTDRHPETKKLWPAISPEIINIWRELADYPANPQCCLVNYYDKENKSLGMHKDIDEKDFKAPILSISLGDTCRFRYGIDPKKQSPSKTVSLESGTVLVMKNESRLLYHSVDKVLFGSSTLLHNSLGAGRLNLTLRVVYRSAQEV
jgi:alkylated DNA repair protein (DNA oxidative demethylase)